jgi:hypothetical protein
MRSRVPAKLVIVLSRGGRPERDETACTAEEQGYGQLQNGSPPPAGTSGVILKPAVGAECEGGG